MTSAHTPPWEQESGDWAADPDRIDVHASVLDAVGRTPMVRLRQLVPEDCAEIVVKLDYLNPGGSTKDRPLARIILEAEADGQLEPGATIIDSSSGNFGIAMAMAGAVRGHHVICVVDPKLPDVTERMMRSLGAELVFATDADETGSYLRNRFAIRQELLEAHPTAFCPDQYRNRAAIRGHYWGTGREIVEGLRGELDALVIATGTGSTVTGCGHAIKSHDQSIRVVATDAVGSRIFDDEPRRWLQKGLGSALQAGELDNLEVGVIDEVRLVGDQDAFATARALARNEGILGGGSAGCAVFAALTLGRELGPGARVVTVIPDRLERYLYEHQSDEWMAERGFTAATDPPSVWDAVEEWRRGARVVPGPSGVPVRKPPLAD